MAWGAPPACGGRPDPVTNARALPIYQTTSYILADLELGFAAARKHGSVSAGDPQVMAALGA